MIARIYITRGGGEFVAVAIYDSYKYVRCSFKTKKEAEDYLKRLGEPDSIKIIKEKKGD